MAARTSFIPMGRHDCLERTRVRSWAPTEASPALRRRLLEAAARQALQHFAAALGIEARDGDDVAVFCSGAAEACCDALALGLFQHGGVREDDFIALRALGELLRPRLYVESGVFMGSSLYAFLTCPSIERIHAIDPDLSNLRVRDERPDRTRYIDDADFGEVDFGEPPGASLVFFDDHVATTTRIFQAHAKGFRHLVFDDSTGVHGITQRLFPAVPTVGMIALVDSLEPGDALTWHVRDKGSRRRLAATFGGSDVSWLELKVTRQLLDEMQAARRLIRSTVRFPDLLATIPLRDNEGLIDRTKYLLILTD